MVFSKSQKGNQKIVPNLSGNSSLWHEIGISSNIPNSKRSLMGFQIILQGGCNKFLESPKGKIRIVPLSKIQIYEKTL